MLENTLLFERICLDTSYPSKKSACSLLLSLRWWRWDEGPLWLLFIIVCAEACEFWLIRVVLDEMTPPGWS